MNLADKNTLKLEKKLRKFLLKKLPPLIARKDVESLLGGAVSAKTLANADSRGDGPIGAIVIGRNVTYPTTALVDWIISRLGVTNIKQLSEL